MFLKHLLHRIICYKKFSNLTPFGPPIMISVKNRLDVLLTLTQHHLYCTYEFTINWFNKILLFKLLHEYRIQILIIEYEVQKKKKK